MIHTNKIVSVGGSLGVIIPKAQLKLMKLKTGDWVEIMYRIPQEAKEVKK